MSDHESLQATLNAISSPASADGPTPLLLPDGQMIDPRGLAAALASLSASQVAALGLRISGISGQRGSTSSRSAALRLSLESKLRARLGTDGSTLYRQIWKAKATPSGQPYLEHTASAHRTSGSGFGSWPTPIANDATGSTHAYSGFNLDGSRKIALKLPGAAKLTAIFPTPVASEVQDSASPQALARTDKGGRIGRRICALSPTALTHRGSVTLNPSFAGALMGYPPAWCDFAPTETRSCRKSPPK
jgi:hypothetical protein